MRIERSVGLAGAMRTAASGMAAERFRMDTVSANIANANTSAATDEAAYHRRGVILRQGANGVEIAGLQEDQTTKIQKHEDPSNPLADAFGMVRTSNVNPIMEMVDMVGASRSYEANVAAFNSARGMLKSALNIGRV